MKKTSTKSDKWWAETCAGGDLNASAQLLCNYPCKASRSGAFKCEYPSTEIRDHCRFEIRGLEDLKACTNDFLCAPETENQVDAVKRAEYKGTDREESEPWPYGASHFLNIKSSTTACTISKAQQKMDTLRTFQRLFVNEDFDEVDKWAVHLKKKLSCNSLYASKDARAQDARSVEQQQRTLEKLKEEADFEMIPVKVQGTVSRGVADEMMLDELNRAETNSSRMVFSTSCRSDCQTVLESSTRSADVLGCIWQCLDWSSLEGKDKAC